jgi:hypothetical protein
MTPWSRPFQTTGMAPRPLERQSVDAPEVPGTAHLTTQSTYEDGLAYHMQNPNSVGAEFDRQPGAVPHQWGHPQNPIQHNPIGYNDQPYHGTNGYPNPVPYQYGTSPAYYGQPVYNSSYHCPHGYTHQPCPGPPMPSHHSHPPQPYIGATQPYTGYPQPYAAPPPPQPSYPQPYATPPLHPGYPQTYAAPPQHPGYPQPYIAPPLHPGYTQPCAASPLHPGNAFGHQPLPHSIEPSQLQGTGHSGHTHDVYTHTAQDPESIPTLRVDTGSSNSLPPNHGLQSLTTSTALAHKRHAAGPSGRNTDAQFSAAAASTAHEHNSVAVAI